MNKCIFIIDIWEKHYCDYINNWTEKNIDKINNFLKEAREKKYTIVFLSSNKFNYENNKHSYGDKKQIKMEVPCKMAMCPCSIDFPCYFKIHQCTHIIKNKILDKIYYDKNFKKPELKKLVSNLISRRLIKRNNLMNEKINKGIIIHKSDFIIPDNRDILLSVLEKNNIDEIYYLGQVINMCISNSRKISINKVLNYDFKCNIIEDLSLSFGYNGFDFEKKIFDEKITPESSHNEIKEYLERFDITFIDSYNLCF